MQFFNIGEPSYVLDAGCGNGYTLASLANAIPSCRFVGFDYSLGMVNAANELLTDQHLIDRVSVCQAGLLDDLSFALKSFDIPERFDCHLY